MDHRQKTVTYIDNGIETYTNTKALALHCIALFIDRTYILRHYAERDKRIYEIPKNVPLALFGNFQVFFLGKIHDKKTNFPSLIGLLRPSTVRLDVARAPLFILET